MRHAASICLLLPALLCFVGCSAAGDITPHKWSPDKPSTQLAGTTWPAYESVSHAGRDLSPAGAVRMVWSEEGVYAKLLLPDDAPRRLAVNLLYTEADGQLRRGRVRIVRDDGSIETLAERTDPGTDTWIPAGETIFSRVATDISSQPPVVYVFLAWETVGLDAPPKDRAWVVIDPAGSQPAGQTPPVPVRFYIDTRPKIRGGTSARCPSCTQ